MPKTHPKTPPNSAARKPQRHSSSALILVCCLLIVGICLVFGQTLGHDFVNYDDDEYVYHNAEVTRGMRATTLPVLALPF
ncbi:MAG TPA: hypothetical protein VGM62_16405 [Chthoniobacterales bacterium]